MSGNLQPRMQVLECIAADDGWDGLGRGLGLLKPD